MLCNNPRSVRRALNALPLVIVFCYGTYAAAKDAAEVDGNGNNDDAAIATTVTSDFPGASVAVRALVESSQVVYPFDSISRQVQVLVDDEVRPRAIATYQEILLPTTAIKVIEEQVKPVATVAVGVANPEAITVPANVMYVRFSKSFLRSYFNRRFEKDLPVSDTILGAAVRGTSHTVANTDLDLVENSKQAQATLRFKGETSFNTTSYSGPVQVHSQGVTRFTSNKRLWFDGLNVLQSKATTEAKTETTGSNITTNLPRIRGRIALRIAEDEVAAKRGLAQQITSERTKQRIEQAFEKVAQERAAAFTQALRDQYAKLPFEGRFALSEIQCSTTADAIQIVVIAQGEKEPTFAEAPAKLDDRPDVEVHIHSALLQKLVVSAELRKTLQSAVMGLIEQPVVPVAKPVAKPAAVVAVKQPEREMQFHWTEGEDLPWLSLAWYAKEGDRKSPNEQPSSSASRPVNRTAPPAAPQRVP